MERDCDAVVVGAGLAGLSAVRALHDAGVDVRALRAPIGPVHWAGTETATRWAGYFDGALQSGERAAQEVIAALGG